MKQTLKLVLGIAILPAIIGTTSCKKYLDVSSKSNISQDAVFESVSYTESAVTGIYAMLIGDNGYGSRIATLYPMTTDEFKTSGSYSPLDRRGISMYGASSGNSELLAPFQQLYKGIERANICIKYIPLSSLYGNANETAPNANAVSMRRLYGESLTLRAQFYYELIRNWGDIPFHKVPAADLTDPFLPKTDRDSIYDQLLSDLKVAEDIVPWRSQAPTGFRVTKAFVKGLRARIALARGGYSLRRASSKYGQKMARPADYLPFYQIARDECFDVMQQRGEHDLNPVYENLFRSLHGTRLDDKHELIMEVGAFGGNASTDSKLGYYNGMIHNSASRFGGGGGGEVGVATYFYEFDSVGDCRRDVTLAFYSIDATSQAILGAPNAMNDGKFRRSWTTVTGTSQNLAINWPLMRFADVLLMFAEAENELKGGPTAAAASALQEVRSRAFTGHLDRMPAAPTSKDSFFNAIVKERYLEFGGEGIRKYDLLRWNLLSAKIDEVRSKMRDFYQRLGRYANIPTVIYTKASAYDPSLSASASVNNLDFAGGLKPAQVFYQPQALGAQPTGYTTVKWATAVAETDLTSTTTGLFYYFIPNARELYPLHNDILTTNYRLQQDYGY